MHHICSVWYTASCYSLASYRICSTKSIDLSKLFSPLLEKNSLNFFFLDIFLFYLLPNNIFYNINLFQLVSIERFLYINTLGHFIPIDISYLFLKRSYTHPLLILDNFFLKQFITSMKQNPKGCHIYSLPDQIFKC